MALENLYELDCSGCNNITHVGILNLPKLTNIKNHNGDPVVNQPANINNNSVRKYHKNSQKIDHKLNLMLPSVIIEIILLYGGYEQVILFQDNYPQLLKSTKILNIYDVNPANYKYIKHIEITAANDLQLLKHMEITKLDINDVKIFYINAYKKYLSNLTYLSCNNTNITDDDLKDCANITHLSCNNTIITDACINNLPRIKHLSCNNTRITDNSIKKLSKLTYLSCDSTKITDAGIHDLLNIEYLTCEDTKITRNGVLRLPNLKKYIVTDYFLRK
jgi:hypothetical protein